MSSGTKTGLVGFFDILGYQNLLEQNEPEVIAEEVLPILTGLKSATKTAIFDSMSKSLMRGKRNTIEPIVESMEWLVFSDTILLTLSFDENDVSLNDDYWFVFLLASIQIQTQLFNAGLPARGAIDYGKFFVQEGCFAGRCIVNAYKLSSTIEMAACVLSDEAVTTFESIKNVENKGIRLRTRPRMFQMLVIPYLVPTKQGEVRMHTVKACLASNPDIHGKVMRAFWGNTKDIAQSVRPKIANTEQWLEFLDFKDA